MRWAVARSARAVAWCSSDLPGRWRRLAQCWSWLVVLRPRSSARNSSGAPTISASGLAGGGDPRPGGAAPGGQQHAQRLPLPPTPWGSQVVVAKRLAGGPDRVQRVALGASPGGRPLGSTHLDDVLAVLLQESCQPGAEAACPLDRPAATAGNLRVGEAQQPPIAGRVGAGGGLGQHATKAVDGGGGQGACGGCRRR
jgi:hypothetical protein